MTKALFSKSKRKSELLEIIHSDVYGPMSIRSNSGVSYFIIFIDDHSRWCEVRFIRSKNEVIKAFKKFKLNENSVKTLTGRKINYLQSNNGKKYWNKVFDDILKSNGISRRLIVTHTPK